MIKQNHIFIKYLTISFITVAGILRADTTLDNSSFTSGGGSSASSNYSLQDVIGGISGASSVNNATTWICEVGGNPNLTIGDVTPFSMPKSQWRVLNGLPINGTGLGADDADPAGDSVPNLLKYALGLYAHVPATSTTLPIVSVTNDGFLKIQFTHNSTATDIKYEIQASNDCKTWTSLGTLNPGETSWIMNGANVSESNGIVTGIDQTAISSKKKRFLRLKITAP